MRQWFEDKGYFLYHPLVVKGTSSGFLVPSIDFEQVDLSRDEPFPYAYTSGPRTKGDYLFGVPNASNVALSSVLLAFPHDSSIIDRVEFSTRRIPKPDMFSYGLSRWEALN